MWIDVSQIEDKPLRIDLSEPAESFSILSSELHLRDTVEVHGELTRIEDNFLLTGTVDAGAIFICDRCGEEYPFLLHLDLSTLFLPEEEKQKNDEAGEEDLELYFYNDGRIDLGATLREAILLSIPMKKLCSEDCQGLCPNCGTNLNRSSCNCRFEEIDSRLEILKQLKARKE